MLETWVRVPIPPPVKPFMKVQLCWSFEKTVVHRVTMQHLGSSPKAYWGNGWIEVQGLKPQWINAYSGSLTQLVE